MIFGENSKNEIEKFALLKSKLSDKNFTKIVDKRNFLCSNLKNYWQKLIKFEFEMQNKI